jgi:putative ABC transport system permease protein
MRIIFRDLWRGLRSEPLTAALAVISMSVGLATATVTLCIVNSIMHPLPYRSPEKIVELVQMERNSGSPRAYSYRFFYDAAGKLPGVQALSPLSFSDMILDDEDKTKIDPIVVSGLSCSASLFDVLDVTPLRGRLFERREEPPDAESFVALISEELWRTRYGSDDNLVGKSIRLNELPFTVVGVMKAGMRLPPEPTAPGVWIPLGCDPLIAQVKKFVPSTWDRSAYLVAIWARLSDGFSIHLVEGPIRETAVPILVQDDPDREPDTDFQIVQVEEQIRSKYSLEARILTAAALLVLAVGCFNVSSMVLARAMSHRPELAIRLALGASQLVVAARVLANGVLVSVLGAFVGVLAAKLTLATLAAVVPQGLLPYHEVALGTASLTIILALALGCGILISIWPAIALTQLGPNLLESLHRYAPEGRSMKMKSQILVTAQIGCAVLALVLFAGFFRTYRNITATRLGFDPAPVLIATLRLPQNAFSGERWKRLGNQLEDEFTSHQGVISAAIAVSPPLSRSLRTSYTILGSTNQGSGKPADYRVVGPDYFDVLGLPIVKGRPILHSDIWGARSVCVINETLARSESIEGHEIGSMIRPAGEDSCNVVGVVGDVASYNPRSSPSQAIYVPFDQMPSDHIQGFVSVLVRIAGNTSRAYQIGALAESMRRSAPTLPAKIQPLTAVVAERTLPEGFRASLMGTVSSIAVILAACGVYGTTANYVARQRRNLTIQLALGSTTARIISAVLRDTLLLAATGLLLGLAVAYPLLRFLSGMLFGMAGIDLLTIALCAVFISAVVSFSAYLPARRVLRLHVGDLLKDV